MDFRRYKYDNDSREWQVVWEDETYTFSYRTANGEYVYVIEYDGDGYCRVQTQDGKTGYIGAKALRRYYGDVWADSAPGWFLVASRNPVGYCYLYTAASSSSSRSCSVSRALMRLSVET